jgi:CubicO group peptidase (beta-lactamase class C family)
MTDVQVHPTALDADLEALLTGIEGVALTPREVREHEMLPAHVAAGHSARGEGAVEIAHTWPTGPSYSFDVVGFADALHNQVKNDVAGYTMRLRQGGQTIYTLEWNWAKEPQDTGEGWTPEIRMHVASCSKVITAITMTKLLAAKGIAPTTPIAGYLPGYWVKGTNVDKITFADLLTHRSGLHYGGDETASDYQFMKAQVASGTTHYGQYSYQNMNFGLCRILISTISGAVAVNYLPPFLTYLTDVMWDAITLKAYQSYVHLNVFAPAGVVDGSLVHQPADALAYAFPVSGNGWNSGDLTTLAGGAGWHVTVDDLLDVMGTFRRSGSIVTPARAQAMLDAGYGIDVIQSTPLGNLYGKNGGWADGAGHTEQCVAFFLPEDMELAVFVNSPIGAPPQFLLGLVTNLYASHIVP